MVGKKGCGAGKPILYIFFFQVEIVVESGGNVLVLTIGQQLVLLLLCVYLYTYAVLETTGGEGEGEGERVERGCEQSVSLVPIW